MECPEAVQAKLESQNRLWDKGFTRRRFLGGVGMVGVAALATQLVTSRVSFSAAGASTGNSLIVIFMRGGADGLRILVPNANSLGLADLQSQRPGLVPGAQSLLPLSGAGGWALNGAMSPLLPYWTSGELGFVPAAAVENLSRSHFQAQRLIESGGSPTASSGWLDRTLTQLGPGTTFRAVTDGGPAPASLAGDELSLAIDSLSDFALNWAPGGVAANQTALTSLYRGFNGFLAEDAPAAITASQAAASLVTANPAPQNGATYPDGPFSQSLKDMANLLRAGVGLEVGTIDVGGWDTHTSETSELDGGARLGRVLARRIPAGPRSDVARDHDRRGDERVRPPGRPERQRGNRSRPRQRDVAARRRPQERRDLRRMERRGAGRARSGRRAAGQQLVRRPRVSCCRPG